MDPSSISQLLNFFLTLPDVSYKYRRVFPNFPFFFKWLKSPMFFSSWFMPEISCVRIAARLSLNSDLWTNFPLSGESREFPRPLNTPAIPHPLCPPPPPRPVETCMFEPSLCVPGLQCPLPLKQRGSGGICLIIIRLDKGVLKMKEANHRASLSKVCLLDWGGADPSPPSPLVRHIHYPTFGPSLTHIQTTSFPLNRPQ